MAMRFSLILIVSLLVTTSFGCRHGSDTLNNGHVATDNVGTVGKTSFPSVTVASELFREPIAESNALGLLHSLSALPEIEPDCKFEVQAGLNSDWVRRTDGLEANSTTLQRILATSKIAEADDPLLRAYHLAPWFKASFIDKVGVKWSMDVYLGSLAVLSADGKKAAMYFDLSS